MIKVFLWVLTVNGADFSVPMTYENCVKSMAVAADTVGVSAVSCRQLKGIVR